MFRNPLSWKEWLVYAGLVIASIGGALLLVEVLEVLGDR